MEIKKEWGMSSIWQSYHKNSRRYHIQFQRWRVQKIKNKIGKSLIPSMKFEIINGKMTEKPSSSEKKRKWNN